MPYDNPTQGGGGGYAPDDSQESGPQSAAPEGDEHEQPAEGQGYTCFLPGDFPGAENLKAGDVLTLKVVGKDKEGDIEVQHMSDGEEKPMPDQGMMGHFDNEVGQK